MKELNSVLTEPVGIPVMSKERGIPESNSMIFFSNPQGQMVKSPVTGRMEPRYPKWKRNLFRYLVTLPVISLCLVVVLGVMLLMLQLQTWTDRR